MSVLVIIVTYNGAKWIEKCVSSVLESSLPSDILLIDNDSSDQTVQLIEEMDSQTIEIIKTGENLGFGKANNLGIKRGLEGNYQFFFLLNQDAYLDGDTLRHLTELLSCNKDYGILSPIHLDGQGQKLDYNFSKYCGLKSCPNFITDLYIRREAINAIYPIEFVNAAAWLVSRECIEKVGGFDPIFPHYGEDNDYINRLKYHKLLVGIVPAVTVRHDRSNDIAEIERTFDSPQKRFTKLLRYCKDINQPISSQYKMVFSILLGDLLKGLAQIKFHQSAGAIQMLVTIARSFNKINLHRKLSSRVGATFLK